MKKYLALLFLTACTSSSEVSCKVHPDFSPVKLEDGKPGFMVQCKGLGDQECMEFATDVCKQGANLLHRNVSNVPGQLLISCQ